MDGLKLGETAIDNANEIRGLGFQKFKTHIYVNSRRQRDSATGLASPTTARTLCCAAVVKMMAAAIPAVSVGANITNNVIQNNVFTGRRGWRRAKWQLHHLC